MVREILDRRVPQFVGLYLVGCWGFLEFFNWAVDRYLLSPSLVDFAFALLLLFLPAVIVIAWRHGAPGPDEWTRLDGALIGANALVAAVILGVTFWGDNLGATTTVKLIQDTEGNTVERVVPKASARRGVLVFDLESETGDPEDDWLEYSVTMALGFDIAQDVFVSATSPYEASIREFLAERGLDLDDDIPLALKRDAARLRGMGHFFAGSIHEGPDSLRVRTRLYDTGSGRVVASHDYGLDDARRVADRISLDLRRDLGIPEGQIEQAVDLPVEELLTESAEAYRLASNGWVKLLRDNDPTAAAALADRALALDSTSAFSYLVEANAALFSGNQPEAAEAVQKVLRYGYRLPERMRLGVEVQNEYLFEQDLDAAIRAGRYWTEVYPQDVDARRLLASILGASGDQDGQIRQLRALLAIDSTDVTAMRQLATAFAVQRRYDSAIAYSERLVERQPGDLDVRLHLAGILEAAGRFEEARATLEDAAVVAPRDPDVPRELAELDLRAGAMDGAEERLEEVRELERTPAEEARRIGLEESLYYQRGQLDRLEDAYRRRLASLSESLPLVATVSQINNSEFLLHAFEWGRADDALAQIDSLQGLVAAPWSSTLEIAAARNYLAKGDLDAARASLADLESLGSTFGSVPSLVALRSWIRGRIAEVEDGNCRRALPLYEQAIETHPNGEGTRRSRLACLTETERWDDAEEEVEWLLERSPGRPSNRLAIARYYVARGRTAEAVTHLDVALDVWGPADPEYLPAQEARALRGRLQG